MAIFDAVIVGASLTGLYTGMKLARGGWSVCILDRRKSLGVPVRCGEATGNRTELARFVDVDESWIARDIDGLAVHVNRAQPLRRKVPQAGVILHRDKFERALACNAQEAGAKILLNTPVTGLTGKSGIWTGITTRGGQEISGRVVIGADGCESGVGRWAGITEALGPDEAFSAAQYRVQDKFCNDGFLHFFVGSQNISRGYVWVFPKSGSEISVGAGLYGCRAGEPRALEYLDAFIMNHMPKSSRSNLITGCVPLAVCPRVLHKGNVVVVGDAARQCNPLAASGIMNGLEAADLAVKDLLETKPSEVTRIPAKYSHTWSGHPRRDQKFCGLFKDVLLQTPDHELESCIRKLSRIFAGPVDRSRPFSLPLGQISSVAVQFLPRIVRNLGWLVR